METFPFWVEHNLKPIAATRGERRFCQCSVLVGDAGEGAEVIRGWAGHISSEGCRVCETQNTLASIRKFRSGFSLSRSKTFLSLFRPRALGWQLKPGRSDGKRASSSRGGDQHLEVLPWAGRFSKAMPPPQPLPPAARQPRPCGSSWAAAVVGWRWSPCATAAAGPWAHRHVSGDPGLLHGSRWCQRLRDSSLLQTSSAGTQDTAMDTKVPAAAAAAAAAAARAQRTAQGDTRGSGWHRLISACN